MLKMSKMGIDSETVGKKKNNRRKVKIDVDQLSPDLNLFDDSSAGTSFAPVPQTTGVSLQMVYCLLIVCSKVVRQPSNYFLSVISCNFK
ncbi:hypothetical protein OIU76_023452 [Salix suchowensis]|nr:hypothetical protein OIU76_023452 [Salix suchowensis]